MDVTIVIASFGGPDWAELARRRALPSAKAQGVPVVHVHEHGTLAQARNKALSCVDTEFVIFLDADDQLEPGYVEAMSRGTADLRAPSIRRIPDGEQVVARPWLQGQPFMPKVFRHKHECDAGCLRVGNWLVIGACARTELMREAGGWEEWQWSEDWAMWARMWKAGGTVEPVHDAVYRAYYRQRSRNRVAGLVALRTHEDIEAAVWPDEPPMDPRTHPERRMELAV